MENKISKTLVETLIDLQLEDAPLIVKKTSLGDKCGSCNQLIIKENPNFNSPIFSNTKDFSVQFTKPNLELTPLSPDIQGNKLQLKNIQDFSNRLGFGSYSRMLLNLNSDSEDLHKNKSSNSILPEIPIRLVGSNYNNRNTSNKLSERSPVNNRSIDITSLKLNNLVFSELDHKKRIKGEDLIKAVDKIDKYQNEIMNTNGNSSNK